MIKISYSDRAEIIKISDEQKTKGFVLLEVQDHLDGNWLVFGTPEEHAEKFSPRPVDEVPALKQEVATLKAQVATLTGKVGTVEDKVAIMEAKTPVEVKQP